MSKTLVLYQSKYGATKKYAYMLKEELSCDIEENRNFRADGCGQYDCIIFAGGIYAGGIAGIQTLCKHYQTLKNKKLAVLCVGASPYNESSLLEMKARNLKGELQNIPVFYGRGTWDESIMNFKDRTLCKILQKMVAKHAPASGESWMKELLTLSDPQKDWIDKSYLESLLDYVKEK